MQIMGSVIFHGSLFDYKYNIKSMQKVQIYQPQQQLELYKYCSISSLFVAFVDFGKFISLGLEVTR